MPMHSVAGVGGETLLGGTQYSLLYMPYRIIKWTSVIGVSDYNMKDSTTHQHPHFMRTGVGTGDTQ